MRLRVASIAFLLAVASTAIAWLSLQPSLVRLLRVADDAALVGQIRRLLPVLIAIDFGLAALVTFAVLHFTLSRPLSRTEQAIEALARVDLATAGELPLPRSSGGPLLRRLEGALTRLLEALRAEQGVTRRQLADLRAAHAQLTRAQTELIASERLATVGKLAAGVAHEVGNPLSGILGYVSLARAKEKDPAIAGYLAHIEEEVIRIDRIVRSLLDLGRPAQTRAERVDLAAVVGNCVNLLRRAPELASLELDTKIPATALVRADAGALAQVIINLLLNAAQAMGQRGRISISAVRDGDRVSLRVDDSGPGIPHEAMPRLFEPFFTTKTAADGAAKGTGLGLAVSLHLVTTMQGRLLAENLPGGGARFTVDLPAAEVA